MVNLSVTCLLVLFQLLEPSLATIRLALPRCNTLRREYNINDKQQQNNDDNYCCQQEPFTSSHRPHPNDTIIRYLRWRKNSFRYYRNNIVGLSTIKLRGGESIGSVAAVVANDDLQTSSNESIRTDTGLDETAAEPDHVLPTSEGTFITLAQPAPGSPFHYAFPVHDLTMAKEFYGNVLGCIEGRSCLNKWQDYSLYGHQIVAHYVGPTYVPHDYYNPVDGDEVPVPRK
jgi:hypothetical protein